MTPGSLIVLALLGTPAQAERVPDRREDASHVVSGTVKRVYSRDSSPPGWNAETYTHFVLALAVDAVEKGKGVAGGEVIYVHCFQCTRAGLFAPGMGGHTRIPGEGDRVRAFLNLRRFDRVGSPLIRQEEGPALPDPQQGTGYEVVYPSGLDWLDGNVDANERVRSAPARAIALDYWWLFLLGVAAGGAGGWLVSRFRARKKARAGLANPAG